MAPSMSSPFPKPGPDEIGPGNAKVPAVVDPSDREMDKKPQTAASIDPKAIEELQAHSRKELMELAEHVGLKVNGAMSKTDLAKALLSAP